MYFSYFKSIKNIFYCLFLKNGTHIAYKTTSATLKYKKRFETMEIQDRNTVVQQAISQKLNLFQVADIEGPVFAEMLKVSAEKNVAEQPKDIRSFQDIKNKDSQTKVLKAGERISEKNIEDSKPKVSEEKDMKVSSKKEADDNQKTEKKEEVPEQQAVEKYSVPEKKDAGDGKTDEITEVKTMADEITTVAPIEEVLITEVNNQRASEDEEGTKSAKISENLFFVTPAFSETIIDEGKEGIIVNLPDDRDAITNSEKTFINQDEMKDSEIVLKEMPEATAEEDRLLKEQASYLDENAAFGNKLKIEVSVEEEKIAAPITKDVLKNRFEIDSLFQSVDSETKEFFESSVGTKTDASVQNIQNLASPQTDTVVVPIVENRLQSEQLGTTVSEIADIAISGKEGVAETTNVLRNEVFAKINDTTSRDAVRGMGKEVIEQIKVNITKSAIKGIDTVEIQLQPEDLGKIQIKMHIAKDGKLQADIITSRAETLDILQKEVSNLSEAFNEAGYDTDTKSFNFSFQKENQFSNQQKDKTETSYLLSKNIEQDVDTFENDNFFYDPAQGLNIRV